MGSSRGRVLCFLFLGCVRISLCQPLRVQDFPPGCLLWLKDSASAVVRNPPHLQSHVVFTCYVVTLFSLVLLFLVPLSLVVYFILKCSSESWHKF